MTNFELSDLILKISEGIDPVTGEYFDVQLLGDMHVYEAIKKLRSQALLVREIGTIKHPSTNELGRPAQAIFDDLRNWRLGECQTLGIPAYTIFSDEDLWAIAEGDVVNKEDLLQIKGIGRTSYEKYGDDIYKILCPYMK